MRFAEQNPFQSYNLPTKHLPPNDYLGSSLTKHTGQLSNLQLRFLLLLKSLKQLAISEY